MTKTISRRSALALTGAAFASPALVVRAETALPDKTLKILVGFPAGGGTDVTARVLAEALRGAYASTVLVENKPGALMRIT